MYAIGLLILRVVLGLTMASHGAQKVLGLFGGSGISGFAGVLEQLNVRPARLWAMVAGLAELVGGLLVALGLVTPIAALVVAGSLLVAILAVHWRHGFWAQAQGFEYPFVLMAGMVAISLIGPGPLSLDYLFGPPLPEPLTWVITAVIVLVGALASYYGSRLLPARHPRPQTG